MQHAPWEIPPPPATPGDPAALAYIRELGGDDLVREMAEIFLSTTPEQLAAAAAAARAGDRAAAARVAHLLRSSVAQMGAPGMHALAERLEHLGGGDATPERMGALVRAMEGELVRWRSWYEGLTPGRAPARARAAAAPNERRRRVAVVDDSEDSRFLVNAILCDRYEVAEYDSGRGALRAIAADPPDLVLLDVTLPDLDGPGVVGALRADPVTAALPVIALTGHAGAGSRDRLLAAGFDDYLTKPILDDQALFDAIERGLRHGR